MASKTKKPASRKTKPKKKTRNRRTLFGFLWRFCLAVFCLVTFVPLALLFLYRIESIHPISTLMIHDRLVGPGAERQWIDFEDMSPHIYRSVLSSEDGKFCSHGGVDWEALNSVIEDAIDGERTRGASTIAMQLVKNLFHQETIPAKSSKLVNLETIPEGASSYPVRIVVSSGR